MLHLATAAILVATALALFRAWRGPSVFDRILALNSVGTKTVLIIALLGFLTERPAFLDLAIVYAMMNFIGTVAALKFSWNRDLGDGGPDAEPPAAAADASAPAGGGES